MYNSWNAAHWHLYTHTYSYSHVDVCIGIMSARRHVHQTKLPIIWYLIINITVNPKKNRCLKYVLQVAGIPEFWRTEDSISVERTYNSWQESATLSSIAYLLNTSLTVSWLAPYRPPRVSEVLTGRTFN